MKGTASYPSSIPVTRRVLEVISEIQFTSPDARQTYYTPSEIPYLQLALETYKGMSATCPK
jgi:hypothetical protein